MKTWYDSLMEKIEGFGNGTVAENLKHILSSGVFRKFEENTGIDVSISQEVKKWFDEKAQPWFQNIMKDLEGDITSMDYAEKINELVKKLEVARAYYTKQADVALTTSLKTVAKTKAMLLEELINGILFSYDQALKALGLKAVKTVDITDATHFEGQGPEAYHWNKNEVLVNHVKITDMTENTAENQEEKGACNRKTDYLPWGIAAFFGLIAWSAAVTKPKSK